MMTQPWQACPFQVEDGVEGKYLCRALKEAIAPQTGQRAMNRSARRVKAFTLAPGQHSDSIWLFNRKVRRTEAKCLWQLDMCSRHIKERMSRGSSMVALKMKSMCKASSSTMSLESCSAAPNLP